MKKIIFALSLFSMSILVSCSKSSNGGTGGNPGGGSGGGGGTLDCSTVPKAFAANVAPIIQNSCAISGCHITGSINGPGQLTTYSEIFNARASIRNAIVTGIMPKTGSLTVSQKNSIICWIDSGAPNN
ncbi:MAG: hypothetical protein GC171_02695 [Terrimonas sp.]|nr:hypothetical protein [Terrimonas sp.]